MESKALDSALKATNVAINPADEISAGDRKKKAEEGYGNKAVELKRGYDAISKNGDTLELSDVGRILGENLNQGNSSTAAKKIFLDSGKNQSRM